ncbi:Hypothetical predicted protein [Mytilus galloprovincialis]|uniref:Ig-like domain-containing protein n=1 Tax=Mytilus galloprovincialis TaxID=29158 RepID=A0A8B6D6J0_MYTGA|nr:Hypothetical predicted protein [Mytilus galloprovincialis]
MDGNRYRLWKPSKTSAVCKLHFLQSDYKSETTCDIVLTQVVIYNSTVKLVCPIVKSFRSITWYGPLNYRIYSVGTEVAHDLSTQVGINETADEKSILLIHQFTEDTSGKFRCSDTNNEKDFSLIIKRNPSDLVIVNATHDRITAVQGTEHNLECRVTSGQPGGNITWSTAGVVVAKAEPSFVRYRLKPKRSYNGKLFKCEAFNSEGERILESSVHLQVFYKYAIVETFLSVQSVVILSLVIIIALLMAGMGLYILLLLLLSNPNVLVVDDGDDEDYYDEKEKKDDQNIIFFYNIHTKLSLNFGVSSFTKLHNDDDGDSDGESDGDGGDRVCGGCDGQDVVVCDNGGVGEDELKICQKLFD